MATTQSSHRLALGQATLTQLTAVIERELPDTSAGLLREIGFAAGEALYQGFVSSVRARFGVETPQALDVRYLGEALGGFFHDEGWGSVTATPLADGLFGLDSADWTEAEPKGAELPCCHFSSGMLSDFFTRLGGYPAAVMEIECRSRGDARCRFFVGSPDLLTWVYEGLTEGRSADELIAELTPAR